ncbi:MAG: molecular chaperone HtpG [Alphaproteobacteria bacterium TMED89]|nr:molecular chaperone HtpG [Rhodospirillaceae bacterium]RPH15993.1 MAG: molecular chaperone HtpG [Alphaproteobacteria bacterium TMED89]
MTTETHTFQAETARLLNLVATALYSEREVFLRELISNASDACDKRRFLAQQQADLLDSDASLKVLIAASKENSTLAITDGGVGMDHADLMANLGTIAKSGTADFAAAMAEAKDASALIGQFGVGFYSAFMVAERVVVDTRKAGTAEAFRWESTGDGTFTITEIDADSAPVGTTVLLYLKDDAAEFLEAYRLDGLVRRYADHLTFPVSLLSEDGEAEQINEAQALWLRSKSEITADQHKEFYNHVAGTFDDPWETLHLNLEGHLEYTALLYIPTERPFDLFQPERRCQLKLFVRRVFITDDAPELMPAYLRFVRGLVDSQDLPLNVSREMLQNAPQLQVMNKQLTKRILSALAKRKKDDAEAYDGFWSNFGAVLKEGLYEDRDRGEDIMPLVKFKTTTQDGLSDLDAYLSRMKDGQDQIFYATGESEAAILASPHLEGFRARGLEVLIAADAVDAFWIPTAGSYQGKQFVSVTHGSADLSKFDPTAEDDSSPDQAKTDPADTDRLITWLKTRFDQAVADIRTTNRLADSPACFVAAENSMDMQLSKILRASGQDAGPEKRILEINPRHPLVVALNSEVQAEAGSAKAEQVAELLFDMALIVEGEAPRDPATFAKSLTTMMNSSLSPSSS